MGITKVCQYGAEYNTDLHVGEESCELRFASRGDNDRNDGGHAVKGGVEEIGVVITEGDIAPALEPELGRERYEAPEWHWRSMLEGRMVRWLLGCLATCPISRSREDMRA